MSRLRQRQRRRRCSLGGAVGERCRVRGGSFFQGVVGGRVHTQRGRGARTSMHRYIHVYRRLGVVGRQAGVQK